MDKNAIKKYAVWAREQLIEKVTARAIKYEIVEGRDLDESLETINGEVLTETEKKQRKALIQKVKLDGYSQVMEEVAYTWFNRFVAIRFMEVNGYLPSHVRVFSDENGAFNPQILAEAIHLDLPGLDMNKVMQYKEDAEDEQLFKYLLLVQCNALNEILPRMFQKIADYTELLLPDYLLREGSVIERLVKDISEGDFDLVTESGQVEILGWLYQFYNDEKKDQVINIYKGAVKKEDIPAATQLFTTDWVVKYIVDNSLGRFWIEHKKDTNLKNTLNFYVPYEETEFKGDVDPKDIRFFDPSMGSGHFLIYAFEILMRIYNECGYSEKDAVASIVENNLFGLDIDDRASQLAYFSVMMKARQYDRRFLTKKISPKVKSICESNSISTSSIEYFVNSSNLVRENFYSLYNQMKNAKVYGSTIQIVDVDFDCLENRISELMNEGTLLGHLAIDEIKPLIEVSKILAGKYTIVATNPPYLNRMDEDLKGYVNEKYKKYSGDLYSVFVYRNILYTSSEGYTGFMTPYIWMFNKTYEDLREYIIDNCRISTLVQMEYSAFSEATVPICSFVLCKDNKKARGTYIKLSDFKGGMDIQGKKVLEAIEQNDCSYRFYTNQEKFREIPTSPIAYWVSDKVIEAFKSNLLGDYGYPKQGFATGSNDIFMRMWPEVDINNICFDADSRDKANESGKTWFPCNKGGGYRRWYGNNYYLANWKNDGKEMREFKGSVIRNPQFYFQEGMTWCSLTSGKLSMRYSPSGFVFESKGSVCFMKESKNLAYCLGIMNSEVVSNMLLILSPTLDYHEGPLSRVPIIIDEDIRPKVEELVERNVQLCRADWDSFEISWDFKRHPLIDGSKKVEDSFNNWKRHQEQAFLELKSNEEELNRVFASIYGLENDLKVEVDDSDISIRLADLSRDIKSLISYAVGCMFGRYSLDEEGICCAGNGENKDAYTTIKMDEDNIIPICDDEYFEDDIVNRFIEFIRIVYGEENLEDNLLFIARGLNGGNDSPRSVIRKYFIESFFTDHCSIYTVNGFGKRPIYWLFDSGKKNGFKCLVYMHRYKPDTIARIRTDYVHEQQARYRTAIEEIEKRIETASQSDKVKLTKKLNVLKEQDEEIHIYEEKIHHLADQMISIDLDDGVKHNYALFQDVLAKIK